MRNQRLVQRPTHAALQMIQSARSFHGLNHSFGVHEQRKRIGDLVSKRHGIPSRISLAEATDCRSAHNAPEVIQLPCSLSSKLRQKRTAGRCLASRTETVLNRSTPGYRLVLNDLQRYCKTYFQSARYRISGMLKRRSKLRLVASAICSTSTPFNSAICLATKDTWAGLFNLPRNGTGAR